MPSVVVTILDCSCISQWAERSGLCSGKYQRFIGELL